MGCASLPLSLIADNEGVVRQVFYHVFLLFPLLLKLLSLVVWSLLLQPFQQLRIFDLDVLVLPSAEGLIQTFIEFGMLLGRFILGLAHD